jgi:copper chaperone CopZ
MTCGGCVRAMTKALNAQGPARSVAIDLAAGRVTVAGLDEAQVRRAAEAAGFGFAGPA